MVCDRYLLVGDEIALSKISSLDASCMYVPISWDIGL